MPQPRRDCSNSTAYFFTVSLRDRHSDLLITQIDLLRAAFDAVLGPRPVVVEATVVMPEHLHTIWRVPREDMDYVTRWQQIKATFTLGLRRGSPWRAGVWTRQLRDDHEVAEHVDYVHFNPVRHGLVARAGGWDHSTVHDSVRLGRLPAGALDAAAMDGPTRLYGERDELVNLLQPTAFTVHPRAASA